MRLAKKTERELVVNILAASFDENKSFNTIIKQDDKRVLRIQKVFEYFFDSWYEYGAIYLSDDDCACAVIAFPHLKKITLRSIYMDIKLLFLIGLSSAKRGFAREGRIKTKHPNTPFYYLLFIGVLPEYQNKGIGGKLLAELVYDSERRKMPMYLETYLPKNIELYKKFGFDIFDELQLGFPVYCMRRNLN
jgi:ribosomal protein S18 acetylase RimI-like enzyme